jgi:dTDP-4-dehydrorhamnose 3,5-epimerase
MGMAVKEQSIVVAPLAKKDASTVNPDGTRKGSIIEGVVVRSAITHVDLRGQMCEVNDVTWDINAFPIGWVSMYSVRPGMAKGWVVHRKQDDRNFLARGRVKWVLYDDREDSPTYKAVSEVYASEFNRALMIIPHGVFHAVQNIGDEEALLIDMPSVAYDHHNPDKYRLPLQNDIIPYRFEEHVRGW